MRFNVSQIWNSLYIYIYIYNLLSPQYYIIFPWNILGFNCWVEFQLMGPGYLAGIQAKAIHHRGKVILAFIFNWSQPWLNDSWVNKSFLIEAMAKDSWFVSQQITSMTLQKLFPSLYGKLCFHWWTSQKAIKIKWLDGKLCFHCCFS